MLGLTLHGTHMAQLIPYALHELGPYRPSLAFTMILCYSKVNTFPTQGTNPVIVSLLFTPAVAAAIHTLNALCVCRRRQHQY